MESNESGDLSPLGKTSETLVRAVDAGAVYAVAELSQITLEELKADSSGLGIRRLMLDHAEMLKKLDQAKDELTANKVEIEHLTASKTNAVSGSVLGVVGTGIVGVGFKLMTMTDPAKTFGLLCVIFGLCVMLAGSTATVWLPRLVRKK